MTRLVDQMRSDQSKLERLLEENLDHLPPQGREALLRESVRIQRGSYSPPASVEEAQDFLERAPPTWMSELAVLRWTQHSQQILRWSKLASEGEAVVSLLRKLVSRKPLPNENPGIDEDHWKWFERLSVTIREEIPALSQRERECVALEAQIGQDQAKVLRQLQLIREILDDPKRVDAIESYENDFSPGNYEVLRTVADRLGDKPQV